LKCQITLSDFDDKDAVILKRIINQMNAEQGQHKHKHFL